MKTYKESKNRNFLSLTVIFAVSILFISSCKSSNDPPSLTTANVTGITRTSAVSGGTITSDGGASVSSRGICWSTSANPTVSDSKATQGTGAGTFTANLTGLTSNTLYYVRAFATNSEGTSYGSQVQFTSALTSVPTLTTTAATLITSTSAVSGGDITDDGGAAITVRGLCWSRLENPTVADSISEDGTATGVFESILADLLPDSTYHIRAYATNSLGTGYGNDLTFTTLPQPQGANEVFILSSAYSPLTLTVAAGTTVVWTNKDTMAHTVTSDVSGLFDSGNLAVNATFSYTFTTAGSFPYHCTYHPLMLATVVVN